MMSVTKIPIRKLASGHVLDISVYRFKGSDPNAPSCYLQSSVHGSEVQGNAVLLELASFLKDHPPLGDVVMVPVANPYASNMKIGEYTSGRYELTSGENYNRTYQLPSFEIDSFVKEHSDFSWNKVKKAYKEKLVDSLRERLECFQRDGQSYARTLCAQLQVLAYEHDSVLDLHTGSNACRYLYSPIYALERARTMGIPNILEVPEVFAGAMDEAAFVPWWELSVEAKRQGVDWPLDVDGFTVELGGQERFSTVEAKKDLEGILNYLRLRGTISGECQGELGEVSTFPLDNFKEIYAKTAGFIDWDIRPGEEFSKGQRLGRIFDFSEFQSLESLDSLSQDIVAPDDGVLIMQIDSAIVHEGLSVASIALK